jgi:hypothetical protein
LGVRVALADTASSTRRPSSTGSPLRHADLSTHEIPVLQRNTFLPQDRVRECHVAVAATTFVCTRPVADAFLHIVACAKVEPVLEGIVVEEPQKAK